MYMSSLRMEPRYGGKPWIVKKNRKTVEKVHKLVAMGKTGAIKSIPQAALEVLLDLQLLTLIV